MFKITAIVIAAAALLSGAQAAPEVQARQAACPSSTTLCGWWLISNSGSCTDEAHLRTLGGGDPFDSIYETDPTGYVWRFVSECANGSCVNKGPGNPVTFCRA